MTGNESTEILLGHSDNDSLMYSNDGVNNAQHRIEEDLPQLMRFSDSELTGFDDADFAEIFLGEENSDLVLGSDLID